jgi:lambda family phage portal protein
VPGRGDIELVQAGGKFQVPAKARGLKELRQDLALFDARMQHAVAKPQAGSYQGAEQMRGPLAGWQPLSASADAHLLPEMDSLRSRAHDLVRNEGLMSGAMTTFADSIIGPGLRLNSMPDWRILGMERDQAKEWARKVEARFALYAASKDCDLRRLHNLGELAALAFKEVFAAGDTLVVPMWKPDRPGASAATCIRLVEAERLCNPDHEMDGPYLRAGVVLNDDGEHVAYHVRRGHPGDAYLNGHWLKGGDTWLKIPARTPWGRPRALFLANLHRIGQNRGETYCASIISEIKMLGQYQKTELQAAIVNALIAAFIKTPMGPEALQDLFSSVELPPEFTGAPADYLFQTRNQMRGSFQMQGGAILPLLPGEDVESFVPGRPLTAYRDYVKTLEDILGVGLGVSRLTLTKDASDTNYSSMRGALLQDWKFFSGRRYWMAWHFYQPVFELWLEEQVNLGLIDAPGFYKNKQAYCRAKWIGPGKGWIDPVKEAKAAVIRIEGGLSTLQAECAEQGLDWEEVLEQRAMELARQRELEEHYEVRMGVNPAILQEPGETEAGEESEARKGKEA